MHLYELFFVINSSFLSDDTVRMVGGHIAALGNNCELIRLPGAVNSATTKLVKKNDAAIKEEVYGKKRGRVELRMKTNEHSKPLKHFFAF